MAFWDRLKKKEKGSPSLQGKNVEPEKEITTPPESAAVVERSKKTSKSTTKTPKTALAKVEKKPAGVTLKENTGDAYRVLVRPVVSEKSAHLAAIGQYAFVVAKGVNKIQVRKAIESVYGVKVVSVRTSIFPRKRVRFGKVHGRRSSWKKAIVTLRKGDSIELYEGV